MLASDRRLCCLLGLMCLLVTVGICFGRQAAGQGKARTAPQQEPAAVLGRAKSVLGFDRAAQRVIHYHAVAADEQNYQSDRTYPPFFSAMQVKEGWFDARSGVERV